MSKGTFGEIPGIPEGTVFSDRKALSTAGIHRPLQAGICGAPEAESIVVSGGYEDDLDLGNEIIYTGHGGRDPKTGKQIADQILTRQNLALAQNKATGTPLRVIRAVHGSGYRYDGLFRVDDVWHDKGRAGYVVWRYRLIKLTSEGPVTPAGQKAKPLPLGNQAPERRLGVVQRVIRNTAVGTAIKEMHGFA